jgi:hypothetical protein
VSLRKLFEPRADQKVVAHKSTLTRSIELAILGSPDCCVSQIDGAAIVFLELADLIEDD